MILTATIVLIIISLVAFILYKKNSDDVGLQNLGAFLSKKQREKLKKEREKREKEAREKREKEKREKAARDKREKAAREKAAREKKAKDPCEWVKFLRRS